MSSDSVMVVSMFRSVTVLGPSSRSSGASRSSEGSSTPGMADSGPERVDWKVCTGFDSASAAGLL